MTKDRRNKLMVRWSIFSAALIPILWAVSLVATGSVPAVESVKLAVEAAQWEFSFAFPRWFDIFLGPAYSVLAIYIIYRVKNSDPSSFDVRDTGIGFNLVSGLFAGFTMGFGGIVGSLVYGFAGGLVVGMASWLGFALFFHFTLGLFFVLAFSFAFGFFFGFATSIATLFALGLVAVVLYTIKPLSHRLFYTIKLLPRWLSAK